MIRILNELHIEMGDRTGEELTLWLVAYGEDDRVIRSLCKPFLKALAHFCLEQGWELEVGDDPYQERSLAIFAQGFASPPEMKNRDGNEWKKTEDDHEIPF